MRMRRVVINRDRTMPLKLLLGAGPRLAVGSTGQVAGGSAMIAQRDAEKSGYCDPSLMPATPPNHR